MVADRQQPFAQLQRIHTLSRIVPVQTGRSERPQSAIWDLVSGVERCITALGGPTITRSHVVLA